MFHFIPKEVEKPCIFTQKWGDHLVLMTLYLVTIVNGHHFKLASKCARGINEQLLKTSGADVLSSMKKEKKKSEKPRRWWQQRSKPAVGQF